MTFSLKVANGDLVLKGSQMALVGGTDKLKQDLILWVAERYGIDRFHPWMGSNLQNYIGGMITQGTQAMVYSEVMRVLDNYQKTQTAGMTASPALYTLSELLFNINSINVGIGFDQVNVAISVANAVQQITLIQLNQAA